MIVVAHRPPLKRIEIGAQPDRCSLCGDNRSIVKSCPKCGHGIEESEGTKALRELGERLESERIWRCVERASQGQGSMGNDYGTTDSA